ncbi:MAG: PA14 domain-containing protein [Planctomycetota bacterium]
MWRNASILIVIASMLVISGAAQAARDVTSPLDTVVGVPDDGDWPPNELPPFAVDDQVLTKYLHFKGGTQATGFRVTPVAGATVVTGVTFTTANDADGRDPVEYELSGSNVSIDGPYTLIAQGPIVDFAGGAAWPRRTKGTTPIQFENNIAYEHYQVMFPAIRIAGNYMQIAEVELLAPILKASAPAPADRAVHEDTWANLAWTAGENASQHDVYFGENPDDVKNGTGDTFKGNQTANFFIVGFPGFAYPEGLVPGTTYYWRIDELNDANPDSPWVGDLWSFTVPPKIAWKPNPPNGAKFVDTNADFSWSPGWGAKLHTVYFGDNFDDVNNATGGTAQAGTTYTLDTLEPEKTYYWRVDEFDALATHKGDVWSFTTAGGGGGIKGEYFNNVNLSGMPALTRIDPDVNFNWGGGGPGAPLPDNGWSARWTSDLEISVADTFTFSVNSEGGTRLWIDGELVIDMWVSWVATKYASLPMYLERGIHSLRLEFVDWDRNAQQQLYWSTPTLAEQIIPAGPLQPPLRARSPNPPNGAVDVKQTPILSWSPGDQAASHQVYFGTDENAVLNATTGSPEDIGTKDLGSQSYDPGQLEWDTTYYWRVDEVNDTNPDSPWTGAVWSLKTANFPVIDDFEYYNDLDPDNPESNNIFYTWLDGFEDPANGSLVGYDIPPFAEQTIVHSGNQSMPLYYDNSVGYSEATLTLTYPRDWTEKGVNTLTIWFRGISDNAAETLYVALNGSAVVSHDNPNAAQITTWTQWTIDLSAPGGFADQGVDLANVNTIAIGLGNKKNPVAGGSGTMYFDDIRLYPPPPEPAP